MRLRFEFRFSLALIVLLSCFVCTSRLAYGQTNPGLALAVEDLTTGQPISPGQTVTNMDKFQVTVTTTNGISCAGQWVVTALGAPGFPLSVLVQFQTFMIGPGTRASSFTGAQLTANGVPNDWKISASCNGADPGQFAEANVEFFVGMSAIGGPRPVPSTDTNPKTLCGIDLSEPVAALRKQTEQAIGQLVVCSVEPGLHARTGEAGSVESLNGKPVISIDPHYLTLDVIAHYLFHWEICAGGAPLRINVSGPQGLDRFALARASELLLAVMEHNLFTGRMRAMGFDPMAEHWIADERYMADRNFHPAGNDPVAFVNSVANYVDAIVLSNDASFTKEYGDWLQETGQSDAANKGREIGASIQQADPRTAEQMQNELVRDLTTLFGVEFTRSMVSPYFAYVAAPSR
jgi:hypothetical protein